MNKKIKKIKIWIITGIIALIAIIMLFNSFTTVKTGYVGVRTRFGAVKQTTISEGLNMKMPFIEKIVRIDCRTKKIEFKSQASSKDLQTVDMSIAINYNVNKETASTLYQKVGMDYEKIIINPAAYEAIKQAVAQYNAEELITRRSEVSNEIQELLIEKITDKGFVITDFNITDIDFSDEFDKAIETKAVKQQEVETAKAELEKQKIQNEKEIIKAEKDAKVMELQNQQITDKTLQLKELEVEEQMINKWNGALPTTMLSDKTNSLFNIK